MTEGDVLNLLTKKYGFRYHGNGQRYVWARHVRSHAGFDARRTADFIAMDLWPSKGLSFHGHEVKVSRSDWLAELRSPEKAAEFIPFMDYWWLVVSDPDIVKRDELPKGWGLMAPTTHGSSLIVLKQARRNRDVIEMPRTRLAAFCRAVAKTAKLET